ncbi:phospholipase [Herbiconiux moechotypicola]|uniref:Dienelactone hydrolase family protein n=1 Tax=Herbiconiux moechotypicola TaxID=637393 RepID=A0ABP5R0H2_9MICO|nr:phospholipase [Herbiconiux moechotypicola]MCS5731387.1 phospholipase [Herbiconiux moechotypicola]
MTRPETSALERWGDEAGTTAVVAVHGRGQPPEFLHEVSARLAVPELAWFAPSAPGRSWYPHPFLDPSPENAVALEEALDALVAAIGAAGRSGAARVVVLGFSQGACSLAHLLLTREVGVAAAVLFTGGFVGPRMLDAAGVPRRAGVPVLMRSVAHDPWVPAHRVADTAALLVRAGAQVDALVEPGTEHVITERAVTDARRLLSGIGAS